MIPRFRAWLKNDKEMIDVDEIHWYNGNFEFIGDGITFQRLADEVELMQSTGLFDKNGQEIFEGDILKDGSEYGRVVYDPDRTMWRVYGKDFDDALSDWWTGRVVGNIYENPELLEAADDGN